LQIGVVHIVNVNSTPSQLPGRRWAAAIASVTLHAIAISAIAAVAIRPTQRIVSTTVPAVAPSRLVIRHLVFIARNPDLLRPGGGGGGGNRRHEPVRHAEAVGADRLTLRVAKPVSAEGRTENLTALPQVVLDAKPLASGNAEQLGLPVGGVSFGLSTGPGSGGGVGEGAGTGIGPGRGPGIGAGSGGGVGGGIYRPGGAVRAPRVISEVKPTYTNAALSERIQGTVVLELVVRTSGVPSDIRVLRSLDPGGLDQEAILAASQWRFEPGRLAGAPVDVLVTLMLDFRIR
jgi:protein TonB